MCSSDIFLGFLAILFPPLPVWVKCGICSADSVINILLCVLGFLPGLLHAWYIIAKFPEPDYGSYEPVGGRDSEHGRVSYIVVQQDEDGRRAQRGGAPRGQGQPKPARQGNMSYGTSSSQQGGGGAGSSASAAQGPSDDQAPPPSYAQVVMGDNKIQDQSR